MRTLRWLTMTLVLAAICGVLLVGLVVFDGWGLLFDPDEAEAVAIRDRSEIAVSTLSATAEAEGSLLFADARPVGASQGTLTAMAASGTTVVAGDVLFALDGEPTVALAGLVPGWRTMQSGDVGPDVEQLEQNLSALGYDPEGLLTIDDTFTDYTAVVVERWQEDVGIAATGRVEQDSIVFLPTPATITSTSASPGQTLGSGAAATANLVLTVSAEDRLVSFPVQPGDLDTIAIGSQVSARLPDRSTVTAVVDELSSNGDGSWTAIARPTDAEPGQLPEGEAVPVDVSWTVTVASDVKTVRANALTRLDNGSYAVEVVLDGPGVETTEFVAVETGASAGPLIEIRTDLDPGTVIIAP